MLVQDKELNTLFLELNELLQPKVIDKVISHMLSIHQRCKELEKSRDNWRKKYESSRKTQQ